MARRLALLVAAGIGLVGGVFWLCVFDPARRHVQFCETTRAELMTLTSKRPPSLSRKQWQHVVAWTFNAHGNMLTFHRRIPQAERDRFVAELRRRLRGPVDLGTIDWIWDEMVRLTGYTSYSDNYRPTSLEKLREFEESSVTWLGIDVD